MIDSRKLFLDALDAESRQYGLANPAIRIATSPPWGVARAICPACDRVVARDSPHDCTPPEPKP